MDNVADRLDAIAEALKEIEADPGNSKNWRKTEFCYLQIRKCVEYVALALLAVHQGHGYECEKIENAYKADVIFNDLGKLNRHGFPQAIQIETINQKPVNITKRPALSKRRMKRIYDDCAVHLHAGTLATILSQNIPPYDIPKINKWRSELASTLGQHSVMLPHVGLVMIVYLKEVSSGRCKVVFGEAQGPFCIESDTSVFNDVDGS